MIDRKEVIELQNRIALSRDQSAYTRLYRIYYIPLFQFSRSFVASRENAEEIVSDVFLQVWQLESKLRDILNLTVFLYTCTRNLSLNCLRKQKRQSTFMLDQGKLSLFSNNENPEQLFIASELVKKIDSVVNRLPPQCRLIFKLIRQDGLKYHEAAKALDLSVKTVEAQMGIAVKRISEAIQPYTGQRKKPLISRLLHSLL